MIKISWCSFKRAKKKQALHASIDKLVCLSIALWSFNRNRVNQHVIMQGSRLCSWRFFLRQGVATRGNTRVSLGRNTGVGLWGTAWCDVAALTTSQCLSDAEVLLRPHKRVGTRVKLRNSLSLSHVLMHLRTGVRQLLGKWRAFAKSRSVPVDDVHGKYKNKRNTTWVIVKKKKKKRGWRQKRSKRILPRIVDAYSRWYLPPMSI